MSATPTSFDANRPGPQAAGGDAPTLLQRLYRRDLAAYPATGPRMAYLAIVVVTTVVLYYMLYIQYAVATSIITHFDMTYRYFVWVSVIGNAVGAFASLVAGLADRWGRANMVVYGLLIASLLVFFGLPSAGSKGVYLVLFALVSIVEGIVLVATPALIRDFSPQLGRATAMGAWTMGPVVGSLVVTTVTSQTLDTSSWQDELRYSAIAGLVVFVVAIFALRELSPGLRDQIMVTLRDRALVEARAKGIDPQAARRGEWRQMLRVDIAGSGLAIALFLLLYFAAVGNFVVYFATTYGYSEQRANAVANWYWAANAIALVVVGLLSDRLKVRKPFMIVGAVGSIVMTAVFATRATHPTTDYYTFAWLFVGIGVFSGVAYGPWMAGFTETVEKHNPAATATGLAVWGWTIRIVVAVSAAFIPVLVTSVTPLVDHGAQVAAAQTQAAPALAIVGAHPEVFAELGKYPAGKAPADVMARAVQEVGPADLATVQKAQPQLAVLQEYGTKVQKAAHDGPSQWRTWWWICVGGQVLFLPFVFLMAGRWSPRRAREDAALHQAAVDRELASLN
ncbi:MFS transporter [Streptomyces cocklensis]|uniref:Nitrate/nitrite transporter NarK n=1 Tax=Actinacidiphila cocklensis TaxID=887465 RepID=A0A9W4DW41_9ACTN|nr:MFS transporter [Actinacidiphila cocklensis]MDD1060865.1 MFS transporter [Actinacidiphila cocklensis]CAG6397462.1 Nitrate/nitrite transporter NarK [Actinacidiphila cocklensis]